MIDWHVDNRSHNFLRKNRFFRYLCSDARVNARDCIYAFLIATICSFGSVKAYLVRVVYSHCLLSMICGYVNLKWLWRFGEMVPKLLSHVLSDSPKLEPLMVRGWFLRQKCELPMSKLFNISPKLANFFKICKRFLTPK